MKRRLCTRNWGATRRCDEKNDGAKNHPDEDSVGCRDCLSDFILPTEVIESAREHDEAPITYVLEFGSQGMCSSVGG
jgi:hypothetical protein